MTPIDKILADLVLTQFFVEAHHHECDIGDIGEVFAELRRSIVGHLRELGHAVESERQEEWRTR